MLVTIASVDDAAAAPGLFARLEGPPMGKVARMSADAKYHNYKLYEWVAEHASWDLEIVRRPEGKRGWVKLPVDPSLRTGILLLEAEGDRSKAAPPVETRDESSDRLSPSRPTRGSPRHIHRGGAAT